MKPSLRENLDHFIRHLVTIDLNMERCPQLIVKSIVDLITTLKCDSCDVSVSSIIVRTDYMNLSERGCEVNAHLTCVRKNTELDKSFKKLKLNHVNRGKSRLNQKGLKVMPF